MLIFKNVTPNNIFCIFKTYSINHWIASIELRLLVMVSNHLRRWRLWHLTVEHWQNEFRFICLHFKINIRLCILLLRPCILFISKKKKHNVRKMIARKKKNMFMSFRGEPRDLQTATNEIRLNVRRGLAHLKCDKQNDDESAVEMTRELNNLSIDNLTSIDISKDQRSDYRTFELQMRDAIYTRKCWKAICCNAHLFKDKVRQTKNHYFNIVCTWRELHLFSFFHCCCYRLYWMWAAIWVFCPCSVQSQVQNTFMPLTLQILLKWHAA